ncbi:MAG: UMP kinase [Verrucomicrobiota bacterium]|nr:UMP kinase [Verrucomicrobiota bacterium]
MVRGKRPTSSPRYRRVLLKLSGEVFQNKRKRLNIDPDVVAEVARQIKRVCDMGVQVAIVIGGGNIFRGARGEARGIDRNTGDNMGMLATVINGLALQSALEHQGLETRLQTAIEMQKVAEPFILRRALRHFEKGRVLIFAAGTGHPYLSTDTAAALRAAEIGADALLKATTRVDGVYSADPLENPNARRYARLTYSKALAKSLNVMDAAAFSLCRENGIPIVVFNFFMRGNIEGIILGKRIGTIVRE